MYEEVVIVAAARTPNGRIRGQLGGLTAVRLGATAITGALRNGRVEAAEVDAVFAGHVLQAGVGQNPARQAALAAGIKRTAPASSVNKVCLSGLTAVIQAAQSVQLGEAEVAVAAGMESMTNAPHLLMGSRGGWPYGTVEVLDHMEYDGLTDAAENISMGSLTDRDNSTLDLTRQQQDSVAVRSHRRAAEGWEEGVFDAEIVPVAVSGRRGAGWVRRDEGIRPDTSQEALAQLRPVFSDGGSITAGNSSQLSDGASAVIITTRKHASERGWNVLAGIGGHGQVAGPDNSLHLQPARAVEQALDRQGADASSLDFVEINEAFAAVVACSQRELGLSDEQVNVHGGAIAIGHPIGASGNRLVVHAAHELSRRGRGTAAVSLCGGGGQGEALILTRG